MRISAHFFNYKQTKEVRRAFKFAEERLIIIYDKFHCFQMPYFKP